MKEEVLIINDEEGLLPGGVEVERVPQQLLREGLVVDGPHPDPQQQQPTHQDQQVRQPHTPPQQHSGQPARSLNCLSLVTGFFLFLYFFIDIFLSNTIIRLDHKILVDTSSTNMQQKLGFLEQKIKFV